MPISQLTRLRALFGVGLNDGVVGSEEFRRLRNELEEMEKDRNRLAESESKLRSEIQRESEARKEIESMWNEKAEVHKTETEKFSDKIRELEGQLQVSQAPIIRMVSLLVNQLHFLKSPVLSNSLVPSFTYKVL